MNVSTKILIVGAGPTGLGAAWEAERLNEDYLLVEQGSSPGGMARTIQEGGFGWDLGGHVIHSHFKSFDQAVEDAGIEMLHPERNGWILMNGELRRTPIQHNLRPDELQGDVQPESQAHNLEEYYRYNFGDRLAGKFFIPFQEKMWATECRQIAHSWTSLRSGSGERNVPGIGRADINAKREKFPYPKGGAGALWSAIASKLDLSRFTYGTHLIKVDPLQHEAIFSNGSRVHYEQLVSTMPLGKLMSATNLGSHEIDTTLRTSGVKVMGLGFLGAPPEALADKSWLYCADKDIAWHRATMLSNYDPGLAGPDRWNILFEAGISEWRSINDTQMLGDIRKSLIGVGVSMANLVTVFQRTFDLGYPVPTLRRDDVLQVVDSTLREFGIYSRGRFGGHRYESCNQDFSFQQGVEAVDAFALGRPEDCYWRPERFS